MNEKFCVKDKCNKQGEDVLSLIDAYLSEGKTETKNIIKRAIAADYGKVIDLAILDTLSRKEIEEIIKGRKEFQKNDKDISEEAVLFAERFFKGDCITITPEKNRTIRICRKYGVKRAQIPELFGVMKEPQIGMLWRSDFVADFVRFYVRTNIVRILEEENNKKSPYTYEISKPYFNERFHNIDVSIIVPIDNLDSDTLYWFKDLLKKLRKVY